MKPLTKYFAVLFVLVLFAGCGGNKKSPKHLKTKDTVKVKPDSVRKSQHQLDYEKFKKGHIPLKKNPQQIIRF
jgi:PBP1b-binding outer membrane lipoprotein LpoB